MGVQSKRGRRDYKSKVKIMMGKPIEAVDTNLWELIDSRPTRDAAWDQTRPSACGQ